MQNLENRLFWQYPNWSHSVDILQASTGFDSHESWLSIPYTCCVTGGLQVRFHVCPNVHFSDFWYLAHQKFQIFEECKTRKITCFGSAKIHLKVQKFLIPSTSKISDFRKMQNLENRVFWQYPNWPHSVDILQASTGFGSHESRLSIPYTCCVTGGLQVRFHVCPNVHFSDFWYLAHQKFQIFEECKTRKITCFGSAKIHLKVQKFLIPSTSKISDFRKMQNLENRVFWQYPNWPHSVDILQASTGFGSHESRLSIPYTCCVTGGLQVRFHVCPNVHFSDFWYLAHQKFQIFEECKTRKITCFGSAKIHLKVQKFLIPSTSKISDFRKMQNLENRVFWQYPNWPHSVDILQASTGFGSHESRLSIPYTCCVTGGLQVRFHVCPNVHFSHFWYLAHQKFQIFEECKTRKITCFGSAKIHLKVQKFLIPSTSKISDFRKMQNLENRLFWQYPNWPHSVDILQASTGFGSNESRLSIPYTCCVTGGLQVRFHVCPNVHFSHFWYLAHQKFQIFEECKTRKITCFGSAKIHLIVQKFLIPSTSKISNFRKMQNLENRVFWQYPNWSHSVDILQASTGFDSHESQTFHSVYLLCYRWTTSQISCMPKYALFRFLIPSTPKISNFRKCKTRKITCFGSVKIHLIVQKFLIPSTSKISNFRKMQNLENRVFWQYPNWSHSVDILQASTGFDSHESQTFHSVYLLCYRWTTSQISCMPKYALFRFLIPSTPKISNFRKCKTRKITCFGSVKIHLIVQKFLIPSTSKISNFRKMQNLENRVFWQYPNWSHSVDILQASTGFDSHESQTFHSVYLLCYRWTTSQISCMPKYALFTFLIPSTPKISNFRKCKTRKITCFGSVKIHLIVQKFLIPSTSKISNFRKMQNLENHVFWQVPKVDLIMLDILQATIGFDSYESQTFHSVYLLWYQLITSQISHMPEICTFHISDT